MKRFSWSTDKEAMLRAADERGNVGFEDCVMAVREVRLLADIANPSSRYPHQRLLVVEVRGYAYVVPYVETETEIFLKTVFPSRKFTALYLKDTSGGNG